MGYQRNYSWAIAALNLQVVSTRWLLDMPWASSFNLLLVECRVAFVKLFSILQCLRPVGNRNSGSIAKGNP